MTMDAPLRLDLALVARGLVPSRSRARDLIVRGLVTVEGAHIATPALLVHAGDTIAVSSDETGLVSRGALKLRAALAAFGFAPAGRMAIDVGASTGGFTQTLIEAGATRVYAVDVGHGQLHPTLSADTRVVTLEGTDARTLDATLVPDHISAITADVSFISVRKALPAALALASPGCWLVVLVKPQFEAGREHVGKGGIVRDERARTACVMDVATFLVANGWLTLPAVVSPITGGSGNTEYLLGATRHD